MLLLICLFIYFTPVILLFQVVSNISQDLAWYLDRVGCLDSDFEIPPWGYGWMSLGGYADERDDVGKLGWRGRFG